MQARVCDMTRENKAGCGDVIIDLHQSMKNKDDQNQEWNKYKGWNEVY
jgi:hypothetical protein